MERVSLAALPGSDEAAYPSVCARASQLPPGGSTVRLLQGDADLVAGWGQLPATPARVHLSEQVGVQVAYTPVLGHSMYRQRLLPELNVGISEGLQVLAAASLTGTYVDLRRDKGHSAE